MKKTFIPNRYFGTSILTALFIFLILVPLIEPNELTDKIIFFLIGAALFIGTAIVFPIGYIFTQENVTIKYLFLKPEVYLWKNIYEIEVRYGTRKDFFFPCYKISGNHEGETQPYMAGEIAKSHLTKKLINEYWDGIITTPKSRKNPQPIDIYLDTTEVSLQENEMSQKALEWIKPLEAQAAQKALVTSARFSYFDEVYNETHERPIGKHTYTVVVSISKYGETDPEKFVEISADLINIYPTKTAYRGVECDDAKEELEFYFNDILENGIEDYIED